MLTVFQNLGKEVERRWREQNYNEDRFPKIATQALGQAGLEDKDIPSRVLQACAQKNQLGPQIDLEGSFGDPPITVYTGTRFYIAVYFWLDGRTDIHQHEFSGAFQVLSGHSVHTVYSFALEEKINSRLLLGELRGRKSELLRCGDVRAISSGNNFIHSVFHLDRPCVSLVVRTYNEPPGPQYLYLPQHLAFDPTFREPTCYRKLQLVQYLYVTENPERLSLLQEMLASSDLETCFKLLRSTYTKLHVVKSDPQDWRSQEWEQIKQSAKEVHGSVTLPMIQALEQDRHLRWLSKQRGLLTDLDHRNFLGITLSIRKLQDLEQLVHARYPEEEGSAQILDFIEEIQDSRDSFGRPLPLLGSEWQDTHTALLEQLMLRTSDESRQESTLSNFPEANIAQIEREIRHSPLFQNFEFS